MTFGLSASTLTTIATVAKVASLAAGVLSIVATATAKKPSISSGGSQNEFTSNLNQGIPYMTGRTAAAGWNVHRMTWDHQRDENRFLTYWGVWSGGGPITEIESFTVDNVAVTFSGDVATGTYASFMWLQKQFGATPESAAMTATGFYPYPSGWSSSSKMSGYAGYAWTLLNDAKKYPSGVPKPLMIGKGVKVYDPRQDSTQPGGSGSCRAGVESTYVWDGVDPAHPAGENPFLHGLTWAIGRWQNGKRVLGLGLALSLIDVPAYAEAASVADANSWKIGGVVYSTDGKWEVMKKMLLAGGGEPCPLGGLLSCTINAPRVSLATITDADIVGKASVTAMQGRRDRINSIIPTYRSETHDWQLVPAAVVRGDTYVTEDGSTRTREVTYELCQDVDQVAQLARYDIANAREFGPISTPLKLEWIGYRRGDALTIQSDTLGMSSQKILVTGRTLEPSSGNVLLTSKSETDAKHAFALGATGTAPPTPSLQVIDLSNVVAPSSADWTLTGVTLTANGVSIPALVVTGSVINPNASGVVFEYRPYLVGNGPADNWSSASIDPPTTIRKEFGTVTPGTSYEVAISFIVRGVTGQRLVLGPVTAGSFSVPTTPTPPDPVLITATEFIATLRPGTRTVDVSWRNPRDSTFNYVQILANGTQKGSDITGGLGAYLTAVITLTGTATDFDIVIRAYSDTGLLGDTDPITVTP